jgi:hypothetical protein
MNFNDREATQVVRRGNCYETFSAEGRPDSSGASTSNSLETNKTVSVAHLVTPPRDQGKKALL